MRNNKEGESTPTLIRVLWVDDQPRRFLSLKSRLEEKIGGEIEFISSAEKALEILEKKAKENNLPDIILSDFSMPPGVTGLKFAEAIRAHEDERIKSLPFCLVSGFPFTNSELEKFEKLEVSILDKIEALTEPQKIRQVYKESKRRD